ncbi:MAG: CoA transferase [Deltaproteobacteria bacterium]|nr:CoA transferase [Deltaproteobacteria bacterium]
MLKGIKVIDLSRNLAAPFCTMILADMGAEVIKIEFPGVGDDARGFSPIIQGESGYFMSVNRNKKGMTLNLKDERGKKILLELLRNADVMVDNFRPGVLDRLGLSYEKMKVHNKGLICASLSGFGHTGPYREKSAYDLVVQGYGGIMSITGLEDSEPTRVGISLGDLAAGLYLAIGIEGALLARNRTGEGDFIDVAMLDCQVALLENAIIRYCATGQLPGPVGNRHPSITPFESYKSADGYIIVCAGNQGLWIDFCEVIDRRDLLADERFGSNDLRTQNHHHLKPIIEESTKIKKTSEWITILEKAGIPCGPINTISSVMEDEQVKSRNMIASFDHPQAGLVTMPGFPIKSAQYQMPQSFEPSPMLGQDTKEILHSLGFDDSAIDAMKKDKVI